MNSRAMLLSVYGLIMLAALTGCASPPAERPAPEPPPETGIATLYLHDPLSNCLSFGSGGEGRVFQDHMVKNRQSDIDFGHYSSGAFTVGIEGGRRGAILDLGSSEDLQQRYGYSETVGKGQGFASIRLHEGRFVILEDYQSQTTQALQGADALLGQLDDHNQSAPVHSDHVYLVRLTDRHDEEFERIVKFQVIAHAPDESVTIRWHRLGRQGSS
jgi:hypothetical protein